MVMAAAAQAAGSIAQGIGTAMGGPNVSGVDSRSKFDSSGWTVATGKASASAQLASGGGSPDPWGWAKWAALALVGVAALKLMTKA